MSRTTESRNKREGRYAGRWASWRHTGHKGRMRHMRTGPKDSTMSLRDWSRA